MKAGFFETDITPPLGADRPACGSKLKLEAYSDPLKIRVLMLESEDGTKAAIAGIDNISTGVKFRQKVEEQLPGINLIASASHTHYGGNLRDDFPGIETAPPEIRNIVIDQSVYFDKDYYEYCIRQFVTAVKLAESRMEEAEFSFGSGKLENLIFNRRIRMKNGDCMTHPGKGNPDSIGYAGPVDESVGVVGVWKKGTDEMLGFILNFSCHACINLTGITSDFPGVAIETVRSVYGKEVGAVYLNGASGDVTQIDNMSLRKDTGKAVAIKVGRALGGEAIKLLAKADKGEVKTLRVINNHVRVKHRIPDPEFLPMAYEMIKNYDPANNSHHIAKTYVMTDIAAKHDPEPVASVQTLQLGPLVIGSTPGEIFAQYALDYKKDSPFPFTWFSQLATRMLGYVPTPECFDLANGGYEAETAFYGADTGTLMLDELLRQRATLTPEEAPQGEMVKPSNAVWGYNFNKKKN